MCFDYGTKRVGIAVTDPLQLIASGLCAVHPNDVIQYIQEYHSKEPINLFLIGLPKKLDNTLNDVERYIKGFVKKLAIAFPAIPQERVDERFTSSLAQYAINNSGLKQKSRQEKSLTDMVSATIMLQDYLTQLEQKKVSNKI